MKKTILILLAVCAVVAAVRAGMYVTDNKLSNFETRTHLYVYPETTADDVLAQLDTLAIHPRSLHRSFRDKKVGQYLQPGHYVVEPGSPSVYVSRMLNNGWQTPVTMTLSGTLRRKTDIASKIARQMMADSASIMQSFCDQQLLQSFGFDTVSFFAMLIPDTYQIYWTATPKEILESQKKAYDAFWTSERRDKASRQGLSPMQASIVASIVSGETNYIPEMPQIASVYLNRLRIGMPLQADPTIAYCYDYKLGRILRKHLEVDSPYNTYKHKGLPPGPIYVPSRDALEAVLNPAPGKNLYFCADPSFNGSHRFAPTFAEHKKNARAFQSALNERTRQRKAQQNS